MKRCIVLMKSKYDTETDSMTDFFVSYRILLPKHKQSLHNQNHYEDDFERDGNDSVNGSGGGSGGFGQSSTIKQKDFIIKKMFKVPSNEQMSQSPSLAIQQASSTFKQPP